eukprot:748121-Hanusia_phi.AAC.2
MSDMGPGGGIQAFERDDVPRYVPDRILRFTGDASPSDPWPSIEEEDNNEEEQGREEREDQE